MSLFRATGCFTCAIGCAADRSEWGREVVHCEGDIRRSPRLRLCIAVPGYGSKGTRMSEKHAAVRHRRWLGFSERTTVACSEASRLNDLGNIAEGRDYGT